MANRLSSFQAEESAQIVEQAINDSAFDTVQIVADNISSVEKVAIATEDGTFINVNLILEEPMKSAILNSVDAADVIESLVEGFGVTVADAKVDIDSYVVTTSKPTIDTYVLGQETILTAYRLSQEAALDSYTITKEVQLSDYTDIKKVELTDYTSSMETQLSTYTGTLEATLDSYTAGKENQLDVYTGTKESELDTYTNTKETELDEHANTIATAISAIADDAQNSADIALSVKENFETLNTSTGAVGSSVIYDSDTNTIIIPRGDQGIQGPIGVAAGELVIDGGVSDSIFDGTSLIIDGGTA